MKITKLTINNLLSFKDTVNFEFNDDVNIFIGPNGSGKSNLISILTNVIRGHFIMLYEIEKRNDINIIVRRTDMSNMVSQWFKKNHYSDSDSVKVEMEITFNDADKNNIQSVQEKKEIIKKHILENFPGNIEEYGQVIDAISNIELTDIVDKKIVCSVKNDLSNGTIIRDGIEDDDVKYLNYIYYIDAFYLLSKRIEGLVINSPFLYFKINRVPYGGIPNRVTISNGAISGNIRTGNNNISDNSYYINQCLCFLAEKDLTYRHGEKGNVTLSDDEDYKMIVEYLSEYGFEIGIKCTDIYRNEYAFIVKNLDDEVEKDINELSSGEKEILNILFGIVTENIKDGILIIDEPEMHLHHLWQKKLSNILIQISRKRNIQIFYSTHSASLINPNNLNKVFRFYIDENKSSNYADLSSIGVTLKDRFSLINATNNETLLFAKNVVLVEGITDKIIFEKIFSLIDINYQNNFEVLATNGKHNFSKFEEILKELKMKYCIISDFDYIQQIGDDTIKPLFSLRGDIDSKCLMKKNNIDATTLFNYIEEYFMDENEEKKSKIVEVIKYIKTRYITLSDLGPEEKACIEEFIDMQKENNLYILKGEIEDYYCDVVQNKSKDINNVLMLCSEKIEDWQKTEGYKELQEIANRIIETFK